MKLKYYMRGLGIGIILTTLILTLGNRTISDEEVVKRATALGMSFEDKEDDKLNEMLGNEEVTSPSLTPTTNPISEPTPTIGLEPSPTVTIAPTKAPEPTVEPEPTTAPKPTSAPDKGQGKKQTISFTIERGMDSKEVANVLVQVGLIQDANDFNKYIIKVGKASNIKAADFKIKENSSYDEIIKMITLK